MRLFVHDFAGYPYPIHLSRALARRGHTVWHAYCGSLRTTPGGELTPRPDDASTLEIRRLELDRPLEKYAFVTRWRQENQFGRLVAREVARLQPDVVVSGNAPLDTQRHLWRAAQRHGARTVFWVQDLIGVAAARILKTKIPVVGHVAGAYYLNLEQRLLRASDAAVLITEDFRPLLEDWGVRRATTHVVENWTPLEEMPLRPADNAWAQQHDLVDKRCLIYAGTLAMKHNPSLLLELARQVQDQPDVRVVVLSEGLGATWLREQQAAHGLDNLVLLGFEPFERMPDVLAAADILVAVLEPDAGVFSVPSKVLAYLCAQRPILLAVPPENLAARIITDHDAGAVVPPHDLDGFVRAAQALLADPSRRDRQGRHARHYAETTFDIERISDQFEAVLRSVLHPETL
ncbi:MAG: glycosyltransferase family 4 protein [Bacteroidota bacterium]